MRSIGGWQTADPAWHGADERTPRASHFACIRRVNFQWELRNINVSHPITDLNKDSDFKGKKIVASSFILVNATELLQQALGNGEKQMSSELGSRKSRDVPVLE